MTADDTTDPVDVRQVSQLHARWVERGPDEPGEFVLSVVLDDGALELTASPSVRDLEAALPLLGGAGAVFVDLAREQVLIGRVRIDARTA